MNGLENWRYATYNHNSTTNLILVTTELMSAALLRTRPLATASSEQAARCSGRRRCEVREDTVALMSRSSFKNKLREAIVSKDIRLKPAWFCHCFFVAIFLPLLFYYFMILCVCFRKWKHVIVPLFRKMKACCYVFHFSVSLTNMEYVFLISVYVCLVLDPS